MDGVRQQPVARPSAVAHLRTTVLRQLRTMVLVGLAFAAVGAAATEAVGAAIERSWPNVPTHVAAAVIALALAYGAVVTIALRATLAGVVGSLEWLGGQIEGMAGRVAHEAEALLPRPDTHTDGASQGALLASPRATWHTAPLSGGGLGGLTDAGAPPIPTPVTQTDGRTGA